MWRFPRHVGDHHREDPGPIPTFGTTVVPSSWQSPPIAPGYYSVTVTDANGCTTTDSYFVENDQNECGAIEGTVFGDFDSDCLFSAGDIGLQGFTVKMVSSTGTEIFAYTNADGHFLAQLDPDTYTITIELNNPNSPWMPCQVSYLVDVPASTTVTLDLPLEADVFCPALSVDISNSILRRCNNNNYYWLSYTNDGTAIANGAYIEVMLDPFMTILEASISYTDLGNNLIRFDIGDLNISTWGSIWFRVGINCDAVLGQTHCVEANIYPHDPCPAANPDWSGASLELYADCNGADLVFHARNAGTADMTTQLDYVIIEDAVMLMMNPGTPLSQEKIASYLPLRQTAPPGA
ncbi:MAG: carboxypeptidase regulatory-like domain-containing protein [Lewinellaceae bacterium]|nr:carboxypeptidase regulatory-like domain-containing protein [Lewinellaceae bacterium]